MARLFERVTVAGVGLIGGSLALAARQAGLFGTVTGLGRGREALDEALRLGLIDRGATAAAEAVPGADLLVLAVPVRSIAAVARQCAPFLAEGAVIMDAGSVKAPVVRDLEALAPPGVAVVGAHPVAGSEKSGPSAATAALFRGERCILTPTDRTSAAALDRVQALWEGVGMRVERMAPERHDEILAAVSHLPHAAAFALVNAVAAAGVDLAYGAGGLQSGTRVAASPVEMWRDIFLTNAAPVEAALETFGREIDRLRDAIHRGDEAALTDLLSHSGDLRRAWKGEG